MTTRSPVSLAPDPLEDCAQSFDDLFGIRAQRHGFRRYLEALLLPAERNKPLTVLANTEPVVGEQRKEAQSLQWFLSESRWDPEEVNDRRLELLLKEGASAASEKGVLVIDEHGDRKWGKHTTHVGRQLLANIGKTENGVVSVTSLWADEGVYYPVDFEPYTPFHHFEGGENDPQFRTQLKIAKELVEHAVEKSIAFRAGVADSFYGEDWEFKRSLGKLGVGYVLPLKKLPARLWIFRSRIISLSERGLRTSEIAEALHCHPKTVRKHIHRFDAPAIDGLGDRPDAGRKPRIAEDERSEIVAVVCKDPLGKLVTEPGGGLYAEDETKAAYLTRSPRLHSKWVSR